MKVLKHIPLLIILLVGILFTSCEKQIKSASIIENTEDKHISTIVFKTKIEKKGVQLVDVRTQVEYKQGHLKNATLIDYTNANFLENAIKTLDKSKPVYLYCLSGGKRSQNSVKLLTEKGYDVHDLIGGIKGWQDKGYEVNK